jgi:hypothetical protein
MRSYMNLAVFALFVSIFSAALSAPTQYRYGNLLVKFKGQAFLSGIPTLGAAFMLGLLSSYLFSNPSRSRSLPPNPLLSLPRPAPLRFPPSCSHILTVPRPLLPIRHRE